MPGLAVQPVRTMALKSTSQTIEQMVDRIMEYPERTKMQILLRLFPAERERM